MKKLFLLLTLPFVIISCTTDTEQIEISEDLTMEVSVKKEILKELEETLSLEKGVPIKYEASKVIEIENELFLRSRSGDYVTTTLLGRDENGNLRSIGISCTSTACANSEEGCRPDWRGELPVCTKCTIGAGDCTKTVSSSLLTHISQF